MTSLLSALAYSCPLILCSLGALFSEYAGCLALFMDGLVSFAAFLNYAFTVWSGSAVVGVLASCLLSVGITLGLSAVVEKFRANRFIAAIAMIWRGRDAGGDGVCDRGGRCDGSLLAGAQPPRALC